MGKSKKILILIILLGIILRLLWLYAPIERDEGIFSYLGWRVLEGDTLYKDMTDSKPPGVHFIYAISTFFFGNTLIPVRIISNILFIISIFVFYKILEKRLKPKEQTIAILAYTILMNIPSLEGIYAMTETFSVYLIIFSIFFFDKYKKSHKNKDLVLVLFFIFYLILLKQVALLLLPFYLFLFFKNKKQMFFAIGILLVLCLITIVFFPFLISHMLFVFKHRILHLNYVGINAWLLIALQICPFILLTSFGLIKYNKHRTFFVLFLVSMLASFIPYGFGHYFLYLIPPMAYFSGLGFEMLKNKKLILIPLFLISFYFISVQYPNMNTKEIIYSDFNSYDEQIVFAELLNNLTSENEEIQNMAWNGEIFYLAKRKTFRNLRRMPCTSNISTRIGVFLDCDTHKHTIYYQNSSKNLLQAEDDDICCRLE